MVEDTPETQVPPTPEKDGDEVVVVPIVKPGAESETASRGSGLRSDRETKREHAESMANRVADLLKKLGSR